MSYAPHFESLSDTREKLEARRKEVLARSNRKLLLLGAKFWCWSRHRFSYDNKFRVILYVSCLLIQLEDSRVLPPLAVSVWWGLQLMQVPHRIVLLANRSSILIGMLTKPWNAALQMLSACMISGQPYFPLWCQCITAHFSCWQFSIYKGFLGAGMLLYYTAKYQYVSSNLVPLSAIDGIEV